MKWFSKYFFNGLILIVPITITTFVVINIFSFTDRLLGQYLPIHFPGVALVVVLLVIVLVGWLSSHWLLKNVIGYGERLLGSIPVVKFIYNSVKQLATAVFESQKLLQNAVLVPYPHPGVKSLGFLMPELSAPLAEKFSEEHVCVFVPMSLNLTAGFNIIVPRRDIIPLDVTSESALQYVITAGSIMPRSNDSK
ncbi:MULTISPECIES: DUF502 domain-containing protein [Sporomusa]|jgi:uncharacterized membrane protein|uniref:DUF502 domain-containing protein n=2 Tax=Sporomusa TaxID=2375 RepID=A0ABM9W0F1_9FIRM|nr:MULTISPECIES: DUF502 domain-containing protein [Sporomusa]MCM0759995.1 DUF502 domain-containing protein [Sporomusa sphaeroides DSM 2875]OLS58382.1 hypothetical protein SPSPH_19200 [Sporomusa sphaeroides DSM 2875]CVK17431.1 hypothetical protein SSPH_00063 [Sporomusa sphaeroides DSM 2875]SCM80259.1 conserved hypothetical protein [uncultured Sporomusa sp.]HML31689.1 DUF502 domain-containing protein [Sporomusa sphaeroides]